MLLQLSRKNVESKAVVKRFSYIFKVLYFLPSLSSCGSEFQTAELTEHYNKLRCVAWLAWC